MRKLINANETGSESLISYQLTSAVVQTGRLPEKPHCSMNWLPVTILNVTLNKQPVVLVIFASAGV